MIVEAGDLLGCFVLIFKLTGEQIGDAIKADTDLCELTRFKMEDYECVAETSDDEQTILVRGRRAFMDENGSTVHYIDKCSFNVVDRRTGEVIAKARI